MEQTVKLYDKNAYETEFQAEVLECLWNEEKAAYAIILNQTLFFPEEGGQTPDHGTLDGETVLDVQIHKGVITHFLKKEFEKGKMIEGKVDWTHRFNNMQQHSGEHIFSGLVHKKYGYDNVGFHLSDQIVTMDFNGMITEQQLMELEEEVNCAIIKNIPIQISYPSRQELLTLDYRSKIEIEGAVRIVTIPGIDVCACCAPHVRKTGEVGILKVLTVQNYKAGVRISILCGFRALEEYRNKIEVIREVTTYLSANQDTLKEAVVRLKSDNQRLKEQLFLEKEKAVQVKLSQIPKEQKNVILFEETMDAKIIKNSLTVLMEQHVGICCIFCGNEEQGYRFQMGSKSIDLQSLMKDMKENLGAKGGGSSLMIQGSLLANRKSIESILEKYFVR